MEKEIRIQKFLSACGVASRRQAEEMIRAGRVKKNGRVAKLGSLCDPDRDAIEVDGKSVKPPRQHVYLAVNKPREYVSTVRDAHAERRVVDLVPPEFRDRVKPVGRLDKNSVGLMLLSDDGALIYRLTHPRFHIEKEYRVLMTGTVVPGLPRLLTGGVDLEDGRANAAEAAIVRRTAQGAILRIVLVQGRKRQIRRMIEAIGGRVNFLQRTRMGPIRLGSLPEGQWRHLTRAELQLLYKATGMALDQKHRECRPNR